MSQGFAVVPICYGMRFGAPFPASQIEAAVTKLCSGAYFYPLRVFGFEYANVPDGSFEAVDDLPRSWGMAPPNGGFRDSDVRAFITAQIEAGKAPKPTELAPRIPIYVVVVRQGQFSADHTNADGWHSTMDYAGQTVAWAWCYQGEDLDGTTPTVAHEIVEAIAAWLGAGERCDHCGPWKARLPAGIMADAYLIPFGRCVVPSSGFDKARRTAVCMVWRGPNHDESIYFSSYFNSSTDGDKWDTPLKIPYVGTSHSPALCTHDGQLWMAWKGVSGDRAIYWSTWAWDHWEPQQAIEGAQTEYSPALASFNGALHLVWHGAAVDNLIRWSRYENGTWSVPEIVNGRAHTGVTLANAGDLHMAYTHTDEQLWTSTLVRGATDWSLPTQITGATSDTPALASLVQSNAQVRPHHTSNHLLLTWKSTNNESIWQSRCDGTQWSPQREVGGAATGSGPAITGGPAVGQVWRAWRGAGDDNGIWYSVSEDEGVTWSPQASVFESVAQPLSLHAETAAGPALALLP